MKTWGKRVLIALGLVMSCASPAVASMAVPELGTYDRLIAYQNERVNVVTTGLVALALPGLEQFKRGSLLEGCIQTAVEVGGLFFLMRVKEEQVGGDTFQELTVNWAAAAVLVLNHIYSAVSTTVWGAQENSRLRVEYGIDRIIVGLEF